MEVGRKMASMLSEERDKPNFDFDETELRLGLPGGGEKTKNTTTAGINGKRGFSETVDLKLNLSSKNMGINSNEKSKNSPTTNDPAKPPPKAQVVGWPPVRSFRKKILAVQKSSSEENGNAAFAKVSMDGAPYLRKVDLKTYKSYPQLCDALCKMFSSFTFGNCGSQGIIDFMNESKLMDLLNGSDYVPSYQDKDGDWMLVGDVPWE